MAPVPRSPQGEELTAQMDALTVTCTSAVSNNFPRLPVRAETRLPDTPAGWSAGQWTRLCAFWFEVWFSRGVVKLDDQIALQLARVARRCLRIDGGAGFFEMIHMLPSRYSRFQFGGVLKLAAASDSDFDVFEEVPKGGILRQPVAFRPYTV